ncbi:MAG: hypothetical protein AVDCRST_MAG87-2241, partial [uncultured Thermomicrobiales bacterium]
WRSSRRMPAQTRIGLASITRVVSRSPGATCGRRIHTSRPQGRESRCRRAGCRLRG